MQNEENAKIRHAILKKAEGFDDDALNEKPSQEEWSAIQILDHLQKIETTIAEGVARAIEKNQQKKAVKKPIQLSVSRKVKVDAPKHTVPEDSYFTLEEMKERLNASRNRLYEVFTAADDETLRNNSMPHPVFGDVPLVQWFPFIGYHEKRHLSQLEETLRKVNEKKE
ncbi:DinB family protein [Planococcus sp. ISL-109]|uniref:DinB family protein n=1 Tax=Planococcus sp. ISL-109 TaxID=2819166 RepID=UPI001BEADFDA|nr:DinB family protein [Planococcus sp. ISL-109]MBT2582202.1 DinB family protein [Planococcus sp. ISL-109]